MMQTCIGRIKQFYCKNCFMEVKNLIMICKNRKNILMPLKICRTPKPYSRMPFDAERAMWSKKNANKHNGQLDIERPNNAHIPHCVPLSSTESSNKIQNR